MQTEQTQSAQVDMELSMSHAAVLDVLKAVPEVVDLTADEPVAEGDLPAAGVPPILLAEMRGCVKSINDVLGPKCFKSDWRVKWDKRAATSKNSVAKSKGCAWAHTGSMARKGLGDKKRVLVEAAKADPNWKIGNKFPRQKGAAMTDFAM